jgi:hypothetical protein
MATKLTDLTELAVTPATDDFLHIVDVTDNTGGAAGTSKKITVARLGIDARILTQVEYNVVNSSVVHMKYNDFPLILVPAETGKIIVPVSFTVVATAAGLAESSSDDLRFGWDAAISGTSDYINLGRDFMNGITGGATVTTIFSPLNAAFTTSYPGTAENQPLMAWCSDQFNGGWSMKIYTTYYTITV